MIGVMVSTARGDLLGFEEIVRVDDAAASAAVPPVTDEVYRGAFAEWEATEAPHATLMERDGFAMERDEQTNLQVPVFWEPPVGSDLLDHVDMIDGEPTIFLMIASYRDWQCRDTATSALERATFPGRVIVAAVQQNRPGDVGCGEPPKPCNEDSSQPLCARAHQVKVYEMDANEVAGD